MERLKIMITAITVLAPIKLVEGKTEADLLSASEKFQKEFVSLQPGVLRRELVKKSEGEYMDIIQFRSRKDVDEVMEKEKTSPVCHEFFALIEMSNAAETDLSFYASLATYS